MNTLTNLAALTLITTISYGCSSSSSSTPPAPTPNGIYTGTVTGGIGAPGNGSEKGIIYNGRFMVFSTSIGIQQMFDANITITDNSFSGNVSNYNGATTPKRFTADLSGSFIEATSVTSSFSNFSTSGFTDGTINLIADTALFNKGSNTTTVTGSWSGTSSTLGITTTITIDSAGTISASTDSQGCNFTGTIIPANTTENIYNATITSTGGAGCTSLPTATYTGFAWTEGATDTTLNLTVADGTNSRSVILTKI